MESRRALLSVSDKTGLLPLARGLLDVGFELLSTGGTASALAKAKLRVTEVADVTGFPEILDGRVKTLHPKIHAGVLAVRDNRAHLQQLEKQGIAPIDLVAVNLYPFESQAYQDGLAPKQALELIDVGGPTLLRAAAKNYRFVVPLVDPADYDLVLSALREKHDLDLPLREHLAAKAFAHTARYDAFIASYFSRNLLKEKFPENLVLPLRRRSPLRYGENHHQQAASYDDPLRLFGSEASVSTARQLHGKELSYNNYLDGDAAIETIKEFEDPTVCIIKHVTPSGVASAKDLLSAWAHAYATDTYSPFGGVVAVNRPVDAKLARGLNKVFLELILAPAFKTDALQTLRQKKNLRILEVPGLDRAVAREGYSLRSVTGGLLLQDRDLLPFDSKGWRPVTKKKPTREQIRTMVFGSKCVKHVKSNAVVFAKGTRTVGIGGGQTARVDATWIACHKGKENISGSIMASEAFFPFRDAVDVAAENGVAGIVQPGGSIHDVEVIRAADEHGLIMVFTGHRSFRH